MAKITINGLSVDPLTSATELGVPDVSLPDASTSDYILVQIREHLDQAQRSELAGLGVSILERVSPHTYLCRYPGTDLEPIRSLQNVVWANTYPRIFKVASSLLPQDSVTTTAEPQSLIDPAAPPGILGIPSPNALDGAVPGDAAPDSASENESDPGFSTKTVDVVFHDDVNPRDFSENLAKVARVDQGAISWGRHKARISIQARYLSDVAAIDEVRHVESVLTAELQNNRARQILGIDAVNLGTALEGQGQIIVVADSGFDIGLTDKVHPAFSGRVLRLYPLGRPDSADDPVGHGTHVAGSALGDGISETEGPVRGAAPKAQLILQSLFGPQGNLAGLPTDLHQLFKEPYLKDGARIHTNSWGRSPGEGQYNEDAREVDEFVYTHRDFVICFSAGNDGSDRHGTGQIGLRSVTPPGTAKNCITVGASENRRPERSETYNRDFSSADFPVDPIASDRMADNPGSIAAFSGRGPTADNRIKPDLVAPGTLILSAQSRQTVSNGDLFKFDSGTSMAAPLVAGCAALVREFLKEKHQLDSPSAALVKALLINGARPTNSESIPNPSEGFGRVDMAATVGPLTAPASVTFKDEAAGLEEGHEESTKITVAPPISILKVTLVWTDPPGPVLQNNLDLVVRAADGQERHGNQNSDSAEFDSLNNVEQVVWTNVPPGEAEIVVKAHRLLKSPQSYAVVIRTS